jgi:hypothetical protein
LLFPNDHRPLLHRFEQGTLVHARDAVGHDPFDVGFRGHEFRADVVLADLGLFDPSVGDGRHQLAVRSFAIRRPERLPAP